MVEPSTIANLLKAARAKFKRLGPKQAARALAAGALLVDTRCAELRHETGAIPGSVHVPLSVLYWRLDPSSRHADGNLADPTRQVILICPHGYSSSLAAATLIDLGYARATDVTGGIEAWIREGLPLVAADS
jgi:rhodanese-related sulfurtransferase